MLIILVSVVVLGGAGVGLGVYFSNKRKKNKPQKENAVKFEIIIGKAENK